MQKTILVANDDPDRSDLVRHALAESQTGDDSIAVCESGEALAYLRRKGRFSARPPGNPVVMLLDLETPRTDGFSLLEEMKRDPDLRVVPVVCLASSDRQADIARSYLLGANAYVVKPADPEQLRTRIRRIGQYWIQVNEPPSDQN